jgi:hypothetical protein
MISRSRKRAIRFADQADVGAVVAASVFAMQGTVWADDAAFLPFLWDGHRTEALNRWIGAELHRSQDLGWSY